MTINRVIKRLSHWFGEKIRPVAAEDGHRSLSAWVAQPLGQAILHQQQLHLDQVLSPLFGYHLLELTPFPVEGLSRNSRINHRSRISSVICDGVAAQARFEALPLACESIDVVVLHHALDFSQHPHQVLREASRVLIPRGHLVIVGFNPWSLAGVAKFVLQFFKKDGYWRRNGLTLHRIKDWLHLLELDTDDSRYGFYRLPLNRQGVLTKTRFLERIGERLKLPLGSYYVLVARKERATMTPIKPLWSSLRPVRGIGVAKPSIGLVEPSRNLQSVKSPRTGDSESAS